MTDPDTDKSCRITYAHRAWIAITTIQSVMHNERIKDVHLIHWQPFVMYLERAADCAKNLERETTRAKQN